MSEAFESFLDEMARLDRELLGQDRIAVYDRIALIAARATTWSDPAEKDMAKRVAGYKLFFYAPIGEGSSSCDVIRMLFAVRAIVGYEDAFQSSAAVAAVMHEYLDNNQGAAASAFLAFSSTLGNELFLNAEDRTYISTECLRYQQFITSRAERLG